MIIDVHAHCSPTPDWLSYDPVKEVYMPWITVSELIDRMRQEGIDKTVVLPIGSPESSIEPVTTHEVVDMCRRHERELIPFCNPDPRLCMGVEKYMSFILGEYKRQGCVGVGEMTANVPFDDPKVLNMFRTCEELGLPVLFHVGPHLGGCYGLVDELHLPRLEKCLKSFPGLIFIGHSQPFWAEISSDLKLEERNGYPGGPVAPGGRLVELFRSYPNLHADLSATSGYNAVSRDPGFGVDFMDEFQDRLMFGTDLDCPGQDLPLLGYLRSLEQSGKLTHRVMDKITHRNAAKLLHLTI